jgi:hypothetical protein
MSGHLRHDSTCQNCGYTVDRNFCSECGQKNIETRQSFGHLFAHFIEDLTHYDTAFWKTIKYLIFRPARLTKEYLAGHRMKYVPPVKLYIFISFVAFLLMNLMPGTSILQEKKETETYFVANDDEIQGDTLKIMKVNIAGNSYRSVRELDSLQNIEGKKLSKVGYYFVKSVLKAKEEGMTQAQMWQGFLHVLPKVLFIYMPIFALWLWLLHDKKRWYFFDHGIYTLHYFSFLLLCITIVRLTIWLLSFLFSETIMEVISNLINFALLLYIIFYFFRSHSRMYEEKKLVSRLKGFLLFFINIIIISFILICTVVYTILNIH